MIENKEIKQSQSIIIAAASKNVDKQILEFKWTKYQNKGALFIKVILNKCFFEHLNILMCLLKLPVTK